MLTPSIKKLVGERDRVSAKDYNRRGRVLQTLTRSFSGNSITDSSGLHGRAIARRGTAGLEIKIFEVQSAAAGDSLYNCYEQTLDATEWADTAGDSKFDDKDAVSVVVLNLAEFDPEAEYVAHLAANDLIVAWKMVDDEENDRWIGVPFRQTNADRTRRAFCKTAAGDATTIVCYLDKDDDPGPAGTEITVNCDIAGSGNLNAASPRLTNGFPIPVYKVGSSWYCDTVFQGTEDCDCYEAP